MKYYWKFTEDIILTKTGASNSMSYSLMQTSMKMLWKMYILLCMV